jgi:Xaa-Pro aminopeptidase
VRIATEHCFSSASSAKPNPHQHQEGDHKYKMNTPSKNLALLRVALKQKSIDAYIIPITDPHLSENIPDHWQIIKWLTGFSGSAGVAVVTDVFAGLWTDSRYFIQAEKELEDSGFRLMKQLNLPESGYIDWLAENSETCKRIAFDGRILSIASFRKLETRLVQKRILIDFKCDLISEIWNDRPQLPASVAFNHPVEFSGKDRSLKIAEVREEMKKLNINYHLLTSPDDIMWLLNIRGSDVPYSPLLLSFAVVGEEQIFLFIDDDRIPAGLVYEFENLGIVILPYEECSAVVSSFSEGKTIMLNPATTSAALYNSIPVSFVKAENISIPARMKAIKNKTEIENIGKVMVKDGVALIKFFYWIETSIGQLPLTEIFIADKLLEFRSQQDGFLGPSFATITAFNEHAALPHYSATPDTDSAIGENGILLIDSGGQYYGGTTDITRTISIGVSTLQQKTDFTLILKGHINLATAKFPMGTRGYQLDMLARKPLWDNGLNYGHGTGHGVGYCLNVHEGPQNISPLDNKTILEPGMLISNEPAIYREEEYGIRIENLILCYEDEETDFGHFLKFDTVSLCYIDKSLIDKSLLNPQEISWLNNYHSEVFDKISPYLTEKEKAWFKEKTEPF